MSLVDSCPSTLTRSKERATHAPSSSSAVCGASRASVCTKHSIVAKRGEIMPAPLHWAHRRTLPGGQLDLEVGALLETVGRLDRALEVDVALAAQLRAGLQGSLQDRVHVQVVADRAGRGERHLGLGHGRGGGRGALRLGGVVEPPRAGGGVGAARVGEHRPQRLQAAAIPREQDRRGGRARAGEDRRRGRLLGVAYQQPDVGIAARLQPRRHPGGAEPLRQTRVGGQLAHVPGALHPARSEHAHESPLVSGRPNIRLRFCSACEEVPFQRLSMAAKASTLPVCSSWATNRRQ